MSKKNPSRRERRDAATAQLRAAADKIREAIDDYDNAKAELESLAEEMANWYDGMPENLQNSDQGSRVSEAKDALEALDMDAEIEELASTIEGVADEADAVDFPGMYGK